MNQPASLLDEALNLERRVVLIEDCVETSGAFVLHHLLKRSLSSSSSDSVVIFIAFAQPFSHYDRILRKLRSKHIRSPPVSLLDEALNLERRVVLIEDCVETSGAFVLHHLLKRFLSSSSSDNIVVFIAFAQPFSHYDRILRKLRSKHIRSPPVSLLDEALNLERRVVLIEDCVETSGAFVLHHLLKRFLSSSSSDNIVVFIAFAQPFSHYDRILRKLRSKHIRSPPVSLLDEALNLERRVVLIEDCVETSGAFVLHHLLKRFLSTSSSSDDIVIFIAFAQPFSHYDRILRKLGCNLAVQRENKKLIFFDMLMLECPDNGVEGGLMALYGNIYKAVEANSVNKNVTIMIDDISLLEVAANGSTKDVINFMHYCHTLTNQFDCTIITVLHEDIYSSEDVFSLPLQMEYLADITIKTEPLITGLAADVHGQLTVLNKGTAHGLGSSRSKIRNFRYKVKENSVDYFLPGSRS